MEIEKGKTTIVNDTVRMAVGFAKVDVENRIVSGFATMDNLDSQDDIVDTGASLNAFGAWRKNLREMHMPVAVGRVVNFTPDEFYDTKSDTVYSGVWVDAYVSKGAQDTWEKVLDGTLTGFSIGGNILDSVTKYDAASGKTVRVITEYELIELSLVDNPANQLANIFSVTKSADGGMMIKGMAVEMQSTAVFYCETDEIAKVSSDESVDCHLCDKSMAQIGWFEYDSSEEKTVKVSEVVKSYRTTHKQAQPANDEGGVDVADTAKEEAVETETPEVEETAVEETEEVAPVEEVEVPEEVEVEAPAEAEAADVSEVDDPSTEIEKMFDSLKKDISEKFDSSIEDVSAKVEEFQKGFEKQAGELSEKYTELSARIDEITGNLDEVTKSLQAIDSASAVKKSGDLGGSTAVEKSSTNKAPFWGGSILND